MQNCLLEGNIPCFRVGQTRVISLHLKSISLSFYLIIATTSPIMKCFYHPKPLQYSAHSHQSCGHIYRVIHYKSSIGLSPPTTWEPGAGAKKYKYIKIIDVLGMICTKSIVPHFVPHLWHLWHTYKICTTKVWYIYVCTTCTTNNQITG